MVAVRPHQRRATQGQDGPETDPFGHLTPPAWDTIEALEKAFPATLPDHDPRSFPGGCAEATLMQVQRMLGQQDVIQFLRNLTHKGE